MKIRLWLVAVAFAVVSAPLVARAFECVQEPPILQRLESSEGGDAMCLIHRGGEIAIYPCDREVYFSDEDAFFMAAPR